MANDLKYDSAALRLSNGNFDNIKLEDLLSVDHKIYITEYKENLYCPECHKPQIGLVKRQFLRTYKNQKHTNNCSNGLKLISAPTFARCMKSASAESVTLRLQWLIDFQLTKKFNDIHPLVVRVQGNDCTLSEVKRKDITRTAIDLKRIPIKSLAAPFDEDDYGAFKLFYGKVSITATEKQWEDGSSTYYLRLYHTTKHYLIATLRFNQKVRKDLSYPILEYNKTVVNIAFASIMTKKQNSNPNYQNLFFINGQLTHSHFLIINLLESL